jgi:hypothetical protein
MGLFEETSFHGDGVLWAVLPPIKAEDVAYVNKVKIPNV